MQTDGTKLKLHQPAHYRIGVQGVLDDSWSDMFAGLTITCNPTPGSGPITILNGQVIDQAMLLGVLSGLYNLGLCLLWVQWLPDNSNLDNTKGTDHVAPQEFVLEHRQALR